jgi:hypothetical protein
MGKKIIGGNEGKGNNLEERIYQARLACLFADTRVKEPTIGEPQENVLFSTNNIVRSKFAFT